MVGNERNDLTGFLPEDKPPLVDRVKDLPRKLWRTIDFVTDPQVDSVVPSLILFYVICAFDGWYNAFVVEVPTQILEDSLTANQYNLFVSITLTAPLLTLAGLYIRGRFAWTGAVLRLAGDIGVAGVLWTYLTAVGYTQYWGKGNFAGAWVLASALGSLVFIARDVRRLADKERWVSHRG